MSASVEMAEVAEAVEEIQKTTKPRSDGISEVNLGGSNFDVAPMSPK